MRVGTSYYSHAYIADEEDHPHACGDKVEFLGHIKLIDGSSPCVWGQVDISPSSTLCMRIIPMRVGTSYLVLDHALTLWDHPHACGDKSITVADIVP